MTILIAKTSGMVILVILYLFSSYITVRHTKSRSLAYLLFVIYSIVFAVGIWLIHRE